MQPGVATGAPTGSPTGVRGIPTSLLSACMFTIEITNTGATAIQIPQAGLRLTGDPQPNPAVYRLVEFCSVVHSTSYCGPNAGGVPPGCSVYGVEIALENQASGADVVGAPAAIDPTTNQACPPVTLAHDQSVTFVIAAYSTDAKIFQAVPVLKVITATAQGPVTFPQLGAVYSFADPSQFTCYRLSGSTFVAWEQGAAAYDFFANQKLDAWCV